MSAEHALAGFNFLRPAACASRDRILRRALPGLLLGLLSVGLWLAEEHRALETERARQQVLRAELQQVQARLRDAAEQARQAQALDEERRRAAAWQAERELLLGWMETLAQTPGARLLQLRLEGQVLSVQGLAPAAQLQAWAAAAGPPGGRVLPTLVDVASAPGNAAEPELLRFTLRWPVSLPETRP